MVGIEWIMRSRPPSSSRVVFAFVAVSVCFAAPGGALAGQSSEELRRRGYDLAYNLDHAEAMAAFTDAVAADPEDAAAYRGVAAMVWLQLLFDRGALTVDDYLGSISKPNLDLKEPSPEVARTFRENVQKALVLAERRLRKNPRDPDARYEVGAAVGQLAAYVATVEGRVLGSFRSAPRAYDEHERVLSLDPQRKDAGLVVGTYRYVVSCLSLPVRLMAYAVGFGGNKERALALIEDAASYPSDAQWDASLALVFLYNRERRYDAALETIGRLQERFPRNRLLWLEQGATALRAGRLVEAEKALAEGMSRLAGDQRPRAFGEEALWRYKRGAALVALGRTAEAERHLLAALEAKARGWVRGRTHAELGKLADMAGDRQRAKLAYENAIRSCASDNDPVGVAEARALLASPYRGGSAAPQP
jgi:tetratricopeptide (TPR) repeat protein